MKHSYESMLTPEPSQPKQSIDPALVTRHKNKVTPHAPVMPTKITSSAMGAPLQTNARMEKLENIIIYLKYKLENYADNKPRHGTEAQKLQMRINGWLEQINVMKSEINREGSTAEIGVNNMMKTLMSDINTAIDANRKGIKFSLFGGGRFTKILCATKKDIEMMMRQPQAETNAPQQPR